MGLHQVLTATANCQTI